MKNKIISILSNAAKFNENIEMEKINRIAVFIMVFMPVLINSEISATPNPANTAAMIGRRINASGGAIFSLIRTNIKTIINANPISANFSLSPLDSWKNPFFFQF